MGKPKVVAIASFKGGVGKSTISRVLALLLSKNCKMVSFDLKRDASQYSSSEITQMNMEFDEYVAKSDTGLIMGKRDLKNPTTNADNSLSYPIKRTLLPFKNDEEIIILDFGGTYDTRLPTSNADLFIIPTSGDEESIKEGLRTAYFIRNNKPDSNILFLYNQFLVRKKSDIEKEKNILRATLNKSGFNSSSIISIPFSEFFQKLTTKKVPISAIAKNAGAWFNYKTKFEPKMNEIIDIIKEV